MANPMQQARIKAGISQKAAAQALSCNIRTLQRYEQGKSYPTQDVLMRMKVCYSCSIDDLFILG